MHVIDGSACCGSELCPLVAGGEASDTRSSQAGYSRLAFRKQTKVIDDPQSDRKVISCNKLHEGGVTEPASGTIHIWDKVRGRVQQACVRFRL